MIRNLKTLGVALGAVFAFGALVASSASAQTLGKITADGPVTLKGTETGALLENSFEGGTPGSITCDGSTYTGHKVAVTPHELVPVNATEITITPHYVNCKAHIPILGTRHVKVTMNGCDYVFRDATTTGGVEHTYGVTADIVCPDGKKIDIHIYNSATSSTVCTITVGPGSYTGAHLTHNTAGDDIDLTGTFTGIHEEHEGSLCGTGTSSEAELHVDVTIKGYKANGEETPVTITH